MARILVVDDAPEHIDELYKYFTSRGHEVHTTNIGSLALHTCEVWDPHLVIYDSLLTGFHAWKFALTLLKGNPDRRPYLVAIDARPSALQKSLCKECGFDVYVKNPVEPQMVWDWIKNAEARSMQRSTELD